MTIHVRDVMGRVAIAVLEDATFGDIVAVMRRYAVGAVTVIDADRRPVGVVSQDDLLLKEIDPVRHRVSIYESDRHEADHRKAAGRTRRPSMPGLAMTVKPSSPVRGDARVVHERRLKQLPVIDSFTRRRAGPLHQHDVLRVLSLPAAEIEADVR